MTSTVPAPSPPPALWPQTRALLLLADGRAVTLARNAAPLPDVVHDAAARLAGLGLAGWLVAVELRGPGHRPRLRRFREVIEGTGNWQDAAEAFIATWMEQTTTLPAPPRKPPQGEAEAMTTGGWLRRQERAGWAAPGRDGRGPEPEPPAAPAILPYLRATAGHRRACR